MTNPAERYWRALVRFENFDIANECWQVIIPSWSTTQLINICRSDLPDAILTRLDAGDIRFHAKARIGAETADELKIKDWETR